MSLAAIIPFDTRLIDVTSAHGNLFGEGNLPIAFNQFRMLHHCNHFCVFFGLRLEAGHCSLTQSGPVADVGNQ